MGGCPLTEILGNNRVLIENHTGIIAYDSNRICVSTCVGVISIEGTALEIKWISKENLIITGQIHRVQFSLEVKVDAEQNQRNDHKR